MIIMYSMFPSLTNCSQNSSSLLIKISLASFNSGGHGFMPGLGEGRGSLVLLLARLDGVYHLHHPLQVELVRPFIRFVRLLQNVNLSKVSFIETKDECCK